MKYLYSTENGFFQTDTDPSYEDAVQLDEGRIYSILRFEEGRFQEATVFAQDDSRSLSWADIEELP